MNFAAHPTRPPRPSQVQWGGQYRLEAEGQEQRVLIQCLAVPCLFARIKSLGACICTVETPHMLL